MKQIKQIKKTASSLFFAMKEVFASSPLYFAADLLARLADVAAYYFTLYCSCRAVNALEELLVQGGADMQEAAMWIALGACSALCAVFVGHLKETVEQEQKIVFDEHVALKMAHKSMELDISYFDSPEYYDLIAKAQDGRDRLGFLVYRVEAFFANIFSCAVALAISVSTAGIRPPLLVFLLTVPALFTRGRYYGKVFEYENSSRRHMRKMSYLAGLMLGRETAKEIRFYQMGGFLAGKYRGECGAYEKGKRRVVLREGLLDAALSVLPIAGVMAAVYFVVQDIAGEGGFAGEFVYFLGVYTALAEGFLSLVDDLGKMGESEASIQNYNKFLAAEPIVSYTGTQELGRIEEIRFDHVSFAYPGSERWVLEDVSFSLDPSRRNAIVGVNGAGKTTILKLLMRFYDADRGVVLINGIDIREYRIASLRKCFSAVFQDYVIYSLSIRDNIAFSDYSRSREDSRILDALEFAQIKENILGGKETLDTFLSKDFTDDGLELSGGQRQKVAVARCAFSSSQILVMDEPTAALDPEAEAFLMERLDALHKGVVMVSHRLSNMKSMDYIIVLKDGRIVGSGTHKELLAEEGEYYTLFSLQAEKYKEES